MDVETVIIDKDKGVFATYVGSSTLEPYPNFKANCHRVKEFADTWRLAEGFADPILAADTISVMHTSSYIQGIKLESSSNGTPLLAADTGCYDVNAVSSGLAPLTSPLELNFVFRDFTDKTSAAVSSMMNLKSVYSGGSLVGSFLNEVTTTADLTNYTVGSEPASQSRGVTFKVHFDGNTRLIGTEGHFHNANLGSLAGI